MNEKLKTDRSEKQPARRGEAAGPRAAATSRMTALHDRVGNRGVLARLARARSAPAQLERDADRAAEARATQGTPPERAVETLPESGRTHELLAGRGAGQPLDGAASAQLGLQHGPSLAAVRVHTDAAAAAAARSLAANAFTVGSHIVFDRDRYAPATPEGRRLLAHELAHVVQQSERPGLAPQRQKKSRQEILDAISALESQMKGPWNEEALAELNDQRNALLAELRDAPPEPVADEQLSTPARPEPLYTPSPAPEPLYTPAPAREPLYTPAPTSGGPPSPPANEGPQYTPVAEPLPKSEPNHPPAEPAPKAPAGPPTIDRPVEHLDDRALNEKISELERWLGDHLYSDLETQQVALLLRSLKRERAHRRSMASYPVDLSPNTPEKIQRVITHAQLLDEIAMHEQALPEAPDEERRLAEERARFDEARAESNVEPVEVFTAEDLEGDPAYVDSFTRFSYFGLTHDVTLTLADGTEVTLPYSLLKPDPTSAGTAPPGARTVGFIWFYRDKRSGKIFPSHMNSFTMPRLYSMLSEHKDVIVNSDLLAQAGVQILTGPPDAPEWVNWIGMTGLVAGPLARLGVRFRSAYPRAPIGMGEAEGSFRVIEPGPHTPTVGTAGPGHVGPVTVLPVESLGVRTGVPEQLSLFPELVPPRPFSQVPEQLSLFPEVVPPTRFEPLPPVATTPPRIPEQLELFPGSAPPFDVGEIKSWKSQRAGWRQLNTRKYVYNVPDTGREALALYDKDGVVMLIVRESGGTERIVYQGIVGQVPREVMPTAPYGSKEFGDAIEVHVTAIVSRATSQPYLIKHPSATGPDLLPHQIPLVH
ncbi:MAG TPA: DUF4157 domain-containing protein [Polyangia bacterium]|jgi:hypothetical protein|nr:DUF4157 domain-containing protein [Polyangia bacterium]